MTNPYRKINTPTISIALTIGMAAGMLSGLVGIGGGLIIVPALVFFLGFTQHAAQGTSLTLILLPVGIFGTLSYYRQGRVDLPVVGLLAAGYIAGSYFGSRFALRLSQEKIKRSFAWLLLALAVKILLLD